MAEIYPFTKIFLSTTSNLAIRQLFTLPNILAIQYIIHNCIKNGTFIVQLLSMHTYRMCVCVCMRACASVCVLCVHVTSHSETIMQP